MKKLIIPMILLLSMFTASITSCSSDSDDDDGWNMPEDSLDIICQNVEKVTRVAGNIFMQCQSPAETKKYFDDLLQTPNVDDVWIDNQSMYVKIHDFGTVSYTFKLDDPVIPQNWIDKIQQHAKTRIDFTDSYDHIQLSPKKVCIVNQNSKDESRGKIKDIVSFTEKMFETYGIKVTVENAPSLDFYRNDIFDYDIIFLITHGDYSDGHHWVATSEEHPSAKNGGIDWIQLKNRLKYSKKEVSIGSVKETRKGVETNYYYTKVSETFFANSDKKFPSGGNTIMFNTSCQSLKGDKEDKYRNYELADVFFSKGLGAYLGYDETDDIGVHGGLFFFLYLISGLNIYDSYFYLPDWILNNEMEEEGKDPNSVDFFTAHLLLRTSEKNLIKNSCITHPIIDDQENVFTINPGKATFMASQSLFLPDSYLSLEKDKLYGPYMDYYMEYYRYGFLLSETTFLKDAKEICKMKMGEKNCTYDGVKVSFSTALPISDLKPGTTYYYWAFFYDGYNYCYTDYKEFTTPEKGIDQVIPDPIRKTMEPYITIYDGNNPPNIEGIYVMDPTELVHDNTGIYKTGDKGFNSLYFKISNQDKASNTLDYEEKEINNGRVKSEAEGKGAFISGEGNNFSVYFNTTGVTHLDEYDVTTTHALVLTGTKVSDGIKDLRYAFVIVKKEGDRDGRVMNEGDFRIFKDSDGWAERTTGWPSTRASEISIHDGKVMTPWSIYSIKK